MVQYTNQHENQNAKQHIHGSKVIKLKIKLRAQNLVLFLKSKSKVIDLLWFKLLDLKYSIHKETVFKQLLCKGIWFSHKETKNRVLYLGALRLSSSMKLHSRWHVWFNIVYKITIKEERTISSAYPVWGKTLKLVLFILLIFSIFSHWYLDLLKSHNLSYISNLSIRTLN